ncbi:MAG: tape measure protein [Paracoccus hibiscisoli]|uniref:tape measure protein n=1 Tax=Paracoccus hibiscisoli TaxID=2023261 RepID=UPI00391B6BF8
MTEAARLVLIVDTTGMKPGEQALDSLTRKGEQAERRITASMSDIERAMVKSGVASGRFGGAMQDVDRALVRTTGDLRPLNRELEQTGRAADRAGGALAGMAGKVRLMLGGLGAALGVRQLVNYADTWSDISARVGLAVGDMDNAAPTMARLSDMARQTYSSLNLTAEGFIANSVSLRELGLNTQQQLNYTEALNNALVVSGARGQRAESVNRALAASMAIGRMQGDQLNTVLMSGGRIAQVLAAELGTTTNGLRQMATDGKITSDVIYTALVGSMGALRDEAASMPATMGDAFTLIGNSLLTLVGSFDQATGASAAMATGIIKVSDGIKYLATNSNIVIGAVSGLTTALVASFIPATYSAVAALAAKSGAFILLNGGIWGSVAALAAMRGAMIATGIGAFAVAVGVVVAKFLDLSDKVGGAGNAMSLLMDVGIEVASRIGQGFVQAGALIASGATYMKGVFLEAFATIARGFASMMTTIAQGLKIIGVGDGVGIGSGFAAQLTADADAAMATSLERATAAGTALRDLATTSLDSVAALRRATGGMFGPNLPAEIEATTDAVVEFGGGVASAGKAASGAGKAVSGAAKGVNELTQAADRWRQRLQSALGPMATYKRDSTELVALHKAGALSAAEYAKAQGLVTDELAGGLPMIGDVSKAFGDFIAGGLRDAKSAFDSILGSFKNMIAQMIATAAQRRIMLSLGFGGVGGLVGGDALSTALGAAGAPTGGMLGAGGVLAGIGALGSAAMSAFTGGLQAAMGGIGSITQYTSLMMGGATTSIAGFASAAGALAVPLLAVAAAFSFFRKKTKELDAGMRITVEGLETAVETFRKTETRRFWGLSKKTRTSYDRADQETQDALSAIVGNIQTGVMDAAAALGFGAETFAGFAHQMTISTKGMSKEDAQRAVEQALAGLGDGFAGMIPGLNALRKVGESTTEVLNRLSTSLTGVNGIMDTLGHRFHAVGLAGADAASKIAEAFGGLDAMVNATQRFYSAFYTEQERIAVTTRQTTEALARLGIAMPRTRDQYRAMVASLDLTTEAGREAYAALIGMADAFDLILPKIGALTEAMAAAQDAVRTGLDGAIGAAQEAAKANATAAGNWYKAAGSIREYIDKLRGAASALFSPAQAMRFNRQQYQQTYQRALNGDLGAAQAVTGAADRYLSSVMDTARTREEAALAQARVLSQLGLLQGVADIEGARHDVIAGLIGQQVELLTEARDFLAAGGVMTEDMIRTLRTGLGSINSAVQAAQQISWAALQRQLNVTIGIIADADVPPHVRTLLANATNGVRGFVDFVARSDLTPDQKWMALTNASGHLKTVQFLAQNDMPEMYTRIVLNAGSAYRVAVTTQIQSGSILDAAQLQRLLTGSADGRITLGGSFRFDPSAGFATWYETTSRAAIQTPMVALRTAMGTLQTALTALRAAIIAPPPVAPPSRPVTPTTPTAPVAPQPRPQISTAQQQYLLYNSSEGAEYGTRTVFRVDGREFPTRQAAEQWVNSNYPAFAKGGTHTGGPAIIAENAPELVAPSKIYNGSQTRAMLDNSGVVRELQRVLAELVEMKAHARRAAEAGVNTEKLMRKADALGVKIDPDQNKVTT